MNSKKLHEFVIQAILTAKNAHHVHMHTFMYRCLAGDALRASTHDDDGPYKRSRLDFALWIWPLSVDSQLTHRMCHHHQEEGGDRWPLIPYNNHSMERGNCWPRTSWLWILMEFPHFKLMPVLCGWLCSEHANEWIFQFGKAISLTLACKKYMKEKYIYIFLLNSQAIKTCIKLQQINN